MTAHNWQESNIARIASYLRRNEAVADTSGMGAGKTVMACLAAKAVGKTPVVVCPASVVYHWRDTLLTCGFEEGHIVNYEQLISDARAGAGTLGTWQRKPTKRRAGTWKWNLDESHVTIFDEAHRLTGEKSQTSQFLIAATRQGIGRLLLSATLSSTPLKFKALGHAFGLYHTPNDWFQWAQREGGCMRAYFGGLEFVNSQQWSNVCATLGDKVAGVDISKVTDFPVSHVIPVSVEVRSDLDSAYAEELREAIDLSETAGIEALRTRQLSEWEKIPAIIDLTLDAVSEGFAVPIFVQFRKTLEELHKRLAVKTRTGVIYGGQSPAERGTAETRFQSNADNVIISMASAGGTGCDFYSDIYGKPRKTVINPGHNHIEFIQVLGRCPRANAKSPTDQLILFAEGSKAEVRVKQNLTHKIKNLETLNARDLGIVL